jgi:hypothetical protein
MGLFLFTSAIKNVSPEEIASAITTYAKRKDIIADVALYTEWVSSRNKLDIDIHNIISQPISMTSIYETQNRWSVVIYNNCQFEEKEISTYLSFELQTLISLIKVIDSEVWYHFLFYNGKVVDQFCSNPEEYEEAENFQLFQGNLKKLAFYFDVDEQTIAPYLIFITSENRSNVLFKKAFADDRYSLGDEWIFVDFWSRLGIEYPSFLPKIVILHENP